MKFFFEHRISTLADNACAPSHHSFTESGIHFSHWEFDFRDGWSGDAWIAYAEIQENTFSKASTLFFSRLMKAVRRIAFISQSYTEAWTQPCLVRREGSEIGYFRYTNETRGVGLMFQEAEARALSVLMADGRVPEAFFFYWNDAVNTHGYSAKLLLMFSAIEALAKTRSGAKDYSKIEEILGKQLKDDLFGARGDSARGLRHRLVHGEYFSGPDANVNYVHLVHRAVLAYFNQRILKDGLHLNLGVVNPQRHFFGNRKQCILYLTPKAAQPFTLKDVLAEFDERGIHEFAKYDAVYGDSEKRRFLNEELEE